MYLKGNNASLLNKSDGKARGKIEFASRVPPFTRYVTFRIRDRLETIYLLNIVYL